MVDDLGHGVRFSADPSRPLRLAERVKSRGVLLSSKARVNDRDLCNGHAVASGLDRSNHPFTADFCALRLAQTCIWTRC